MVVDKEDKEVEKIEKKKDVVVGAKLVEIPTQTTLAVQLDNGEIVTTDQLLVMMYNKVSRLEKII